MVENNIKKELNEMIDQTLVRVAQSVEGIEPSASDMYSVIRWAKQGLLVRKPENEVAEDEIFDYYNP